MVILVTLGFLTEISPKIYNGQEFTNATQSVTLPKKIKSVRICSRFCVNEV
jgi:hypothetical protein